jgi:DMSO/TMAO reductase YedYZ molybdopterin-dependent catalytic subunit
MRIQLPLFRLRLSHKPENLFRLRLCLVLCLVTFSSLAQDNPSPTSVDQFRLKVDGEVEHPLQLSLNDLAKLYHQKVRVKDLDGKEVEFEGVPLGEILYLAGAKLGE